MSRYVQLVLGGFLCFWMGWFTHEYMNTRPQVRAAQAQVLLLEQDIQRRIREREEAMRQADSLTAMVSRHWTVMVDRQLTP